MNYWDSSALVEATLREDVRERLHTEGGIARTHALAEIFSTLTGGRLGFQAEADAAARTIEQLAQDLKFVELSSAEVLDALKKARAKGVRGGRVHDFLHAVAADKQAGHLLTSDRNDFEGLASVPIEQV
jgi:predicted nucleic acid-binding protein